MASAASMQPAPSRPNRPTTSPLRTVRSRLDHARPALRLEDTEAPHLQRRLAKHRLVATRSAQRRPFRRSSRRRSPARETSAVRWRPRMRPSRMTTMRSEIAKTSASRCETKMMATPARLQRPHALEQPQRFTFGQRGGRLVEDEQPGLLGQRAGDDDELLRGEVERRHRRIRIDIEPKVGERRLGAPQPLADVDHAPARRLVVERDVFGDGQVGNDVDLLRHQRDACRLGFGDIRRRVRSAGEADRAGIAARRRARRQRSG